MVSEKLLAILVCPESRQPLKSAGPDLVAEMNRRVEAGELRNRGGARVTEPLEAGLVREDGAFLYPVRAGIPWMLIDEAIPVE